MPTQRQKFIRRLTEGPALASELRELTSSDRIGSVRVQVSRLRAEGFLIATEAGDEARYRLTHGPQSLSADTYICPDCSGSITNGTNEGHQTGCPIGEQA